MNTNQLRLIADYNWLLEDDTGEFVVRGGRVSTTSIMRTAIALNPELSRVQIVEALTSVGMNASTIAIQFAKSRKESLSLGDVTLAVDGSLVEVV